MLFPWPLWHNMLLVFHLLSFPSPFSFFAWGFLLKTTFKLEPSSSLSSDLFIGANDLKTIPTARENLMLSSYPPREETAPEYLSWLSHHN